MDHAHKAQPVPSPAQAYWNQRSLLSRGHERILALSKAANHPSDLRPYQMAQLIAFALEFAPDIILELGRGVGNSTCAFTQTVEWLKPHECSVLSLCLSNNWKEETVPRLRDTVSESWFRPLQALRTNILTFDFEAALSGFDRIFVFWDAHGFDIAECVLGRILPCIADRPHVVVMHDLSDARYSPPSAEQYGEHGLWKGNNWEGPRLRIGNIDSAVEQAVAILDYTTRNRLELHSSDHSLRTELGDDRNRLSELQTLLTEDLFSLMKDADEIVETYEGCTVTEMVEMADEGGKNCLECDLYEFWPTVDDDVTIDDYTKRILHYSYYKAPLMRMVKNVPEVNITGPHIVEGKREIYNTHLVLRHYKFLNLQQGRKKVKERQERFAIKEVQMGTHTQYNYFTDDSKYYVLEKDVYNKLHVFNGTWIKEQVFDGWRKKR